MVCGWGATIIDLDVAGRYGNDGGACTANHDSQSSISIHLRTTLVIANETLHHRLFKKSPMSVPSNSSKLI